MRCARDCAAMSALKTKVKATSAIAARVFFMKKSSLDST
jgi:hypothetical protein